MENSENIYQVFIASSLRIHEHRSAAQKAIEAANNNEKAKKQHIQFKQFLYEFSPNITQKVEKTDAQEHVDEELKKSTLFFLIIDDVIRSLTRYEFELALDQFKEGKDPQYIFILYNGNTLQSNTEGMSAEDFLTYENLIYYVPDHQNNIVPHYRVYAIPFEGIDNLQVIIKNQLLNFVESKDSPFPGALRSYNLNKDHFFTDERRKEKCPETYHRRKFDNQLDNAICEGNRNFIALVGPSLSGKTRAVMEALKAVENGWIYIVKMEDAVSELERLSTYLSQKRHPKLYIVLDDYDQWAGREEVNNALEKLLGIIWNSCDVIVATSSSKRFLPNDLKAEIIEIKEMDKSEVANARDFFISAAVPFDKDNLCYHRIGALFVNLKELKKDYDVWLSNPNELKSFARKMLLKSVKALSIWRDDNIGNRELMKSLAKWFCSQEMIISDIQWTDNQLDIACKDAMNSFINDKKKGVFSAGTNAPVIVQEYIYRYFIDYDGSLLDVGKESTFEDQKELIKQLLQFCKETQTKEPLTAQLSRLCRRCAFRKQTVGWLYNIWSGTGEIPESDISLSKDLKEDRRACEERCKCNCEENGNDLIIHFYSNLIETYIYCCCESMEEALAAYNSCPENMRTDHLLSALMRKAEPEKRNEIRAMKEYNKDLAYIIAVEIEWAENYNLAEGWMRHYTLYEKTPQEMAICVIDKKLPYDLLQLRRSVATLAYKVDNTKDFRAFQRLIGHLYPYLIDDEELLTDILGHQFRFNPNQLTLIDLLVVVQPNALNHMLEKIIGGDLTASEDFVIRLIDCVKQTLDKRFTDENSLRLLFGYVVSMLIRKLSDIPYEEVYNRIFKRLVTNYNGNSLILRNIYTYTAMLSNNSCDMQSANNLLLNDLLPHTKDKDNPLTINTITLNMIMEKSRGKNRGFNIETIRRLYDLFGRQYDSFTYLLLISLTKTRNEGISMLKEMQDKGIKPNIYILCELLKRSYIPINTAITMLDLSQVNLPENYIITPFDKYENFNPIETLKGFRKDMSDTHIAWGHLFRKKCKGKKDRAVLTACLAYIEEKKHDLLEGGFIYNSLISNETYLPFVNDVMNFIREKKHKHGFSPDSFTANCLVDRITRLYGQDRIKAIDRLNEVLEMIVKENACRLDSNVVNSRLKIFRNQKESLKMDFYSQQGEKILMKRKDGKEGPIQVSVLGYLKTMSDYGYPVESYAIASYLAIEEGQTGNPYNKLIDAIPEVKKVLDTPSQHNKMLLWQFKNKRNVTIKDIEDALQNLNWNNTYAVSCIFGDIMNHFIELQPKTSSLFDAVKSIFEKWNMAKKMAPTPITLSVLAKATSCWEEMQDLLVIYDNLHKNNPSLTLTPQMLSIISSYTDTIRELKERSGMLIEGKGCPVSSKAADAYVLRLTKRMLVSDHDASVRILNDLCQYIIKGGDAKHMLENDGRNRLMLNLYMDKKNVSASLLRNLIYYNTAELREYTKEKILECIAKNYYACIIPLMEMLAADATKETLTLPLRENTDLPYAKETAKKIADDYIPMLFPVIYKINRPQFSVRLLSYLAYGLKPNDMDNYRHLLQQLYEMDCREIDGTVPGLAAFLKSYVDSCPTESNSVIVARKILAKIIVYTKLKRLRNRHLLIEDAPEEYSVWCHHLMDCETILKYEDSQWQSLLTLSWQELIRVHTNKLDDAYPCSLVLCKNHVTKDNPINDELKTIIQQQEKLYAIAIEKGEVYFKDVLKLPKLWIGAKWKASEELVMAMVRSISRMAYCTSPNDTYNIDNYIKDARNRCDEILKSCKEASEQKLKFVSLHYKDIGRDLPDNNNFFFSIKLSTMRALLYDLALDRMANFCVKGAYISSHNSESLQIFEKRCANFIKWNNPGIAWLQRLTERWKKIKDKDSRVKDHVWCPDTSIVFAILENYAQIAGGNGEDADIACHYIAQVKKAMEKATSYALEEKKKSPLVRIKYSMLGITEDNGHYVLVPLNILSKIIVI